MTSRVDRYEDDTDALSQAPSDDGYWAAVLNEGEFARSAETTQPAPHQHSTASARQQHSIPPAHPVPNAASDWDDIAQIMRNDEILRLKVTGYNRGGLLVEWRSLRGFIPASQLVTDPNNGQPQSGTLSDRIDDELSLRVIELEPDNNRLIFSERAAQVASGTRADILESLSPGDTTQGIITNLCDFGAFVDLGGVEGLVHISELSWGRVGHPADLLQAHQLVSVYVLEVDPQQARVALSIKRLKPDTWENVDNRYRIGQLVEGRITNVVDFGAFASIEEGLEGLIHFSELAEGHFLHPRNVVQEGQTVNARILNIDGQARRLGLSLRLV